MSTRLRYWCHDDTFIICLHSCLVDLSMDGIPKVQEHPDPPYRPPQPIDMRKSGLVWHKMPKSQNARLLLLSLKVAIIASELHRHTHMINDHHTFQNHTCLKSWKKILEKYIGKYFAAYEEITVRNKLAYRKFLLALELFNNVLKTPGGELQSYCRCGLYISVELRR